MESRFESLWVGTSLPTNYPTLEGQQAVDVVIVGGGIAGLMAAYFLQKAGQKVCVIEAEKIVSGTTAYTTAKVTVLHDVKFEFLRQKFGYDQLNTYISANLWGVDELEKIVKEEQIDCSFQRSNAYLYTTEEKLIETIQAEVKAAEDVGLPVKYIEGEIGLPFPVRAALKAPNQAQFHPRRFLLAIAQKIIERGGLIFEKSRVMDVKDGIECLAQTDLGEVKAKRVVIATNYPIMDKGYLFVRLNQMRSYALAVQTDPPISDEMFVGIGEHEITIRTHYEAGQQWVIVGGEVHVSGEITNTDQKYTNLEKIANKLLPVVNIGYEWSAQDSSSIDEVPLIGKMPNTQNVFITTGYGEWGMSTGIMSGHLLTDLILHNQNTWAELFDPGRVNLKAAAQGSLEMGKQVVKGFGAHLKLSDQGMDKLQKGDGMVVRQGKELLAVHRDQQNKLRAVSGVCTHMGCVVAWNKAEKTWDCPCHGSRFTHQGEVIRGPATKPLALKKIT